MAPLVGDHRHDRFHSSRARSPRNRATVSPWLPCKGRGVGRHAPRHNPARAPFRFPRARACPPSSSSATHEETRDAGAGVNWRICWATLRRHGCSPAWRAEPPSITARKSGTPLSLGRRVLRRGAPEAGVVAVNGLDARQRRETRQGLRRHLFERLEGGQEREIQELEVAPRKLHVLRSTRPPARTSAASPGSTPRGCIRCRSGH